MPLEPYALCPCGSGKKLKFCCGDILPDLQRAVRIRENQPEAAVRIFRELHQKHPDRDTVLRELVNTLLDLNHAAEAKEVAQAFLKRYPDQHAGLLAFAAACLSADGFALSRRPLHRAFQMCARSMPAGVSVLAAQVAVEMSRTGNWLSAREHLAMSVRFATDERQRMLLLELVRYESQPKIPLMFRGGWNLLPITSSDDAVQQDQRARKLCHLGCWEPAAIVYNRLADQFPTSGAVWFNMGLCQGWDGRVEAAASSLHHAATLLQDFDQAVEAEAIAQEFDLLVGKDRYATISVNLDVRSLSEVLTRLEADPSIVRSDSHDHSDCDHGDELIHVAELIMLSKPCTADSLKSADDLAESIADIDVFDVPDDDAGDPDIDEGPFLQVTTTQPLLDRVIVQLRACLGELIVTGSDDEERSVVEEEQNFSRPFDRNLYRPPGVRQRAFAELAAGVESQAIEEWLNQSTSLLNGRSPLEAAADETLKTKLAACLLVMEARATRYSFAPDLVALRSRLNLPQRAPLTVSATTPIAAVPSIQYERITVSQLADNQAAELANRCSMVGLQRQTKMALEEVTRRPAAMADFGARRAWLMSSAIARSDRRYDLAFECLDKARGAIAGEDAFRQNLELDVRELTYRLDDPDDPALIPLLHRFRDRYLHKIPEIEGVIAEQLEHAGCSHLVVELTGGLATIESDSGATLWTPNQPATESAAASGGLWLPGQ